MTLLTSRRADTPDPRGHPLGGATPLTGLLPRAVAGGLVELSREVAEMSVDPNVAVAGALVGANVAVGSAPVLSVVQSRPPNSRRDTRSAHHRT